jgi:hypothetical protein
LARSIGTLDDATAYAFYDDSAFDDFSDHELEEIGYDDFNLHYLLGSEVDEAGPQFSGRHPNATFVQFEYFLSHMQKLPAGVDVMEIFGGEGGVSRIAARRRLRTGKVIDVITGHAFTKPHIVEKMLRTINVLKPLIIIGGPPSARLQLAGVMLEVMKRQIKNNRYIILANPPESRLFGLPDYVELYKTGMLCSIRFPQCQLGLVSPEGLPIRNNTELWANHSALLESFIGLECNCTVHAEITCQ